jgi:alginate O-acetyltransferase complex protein AlgJ
VIVPRFDLVTLLQLPASYTFIDPITVRVRQVFDRGGDLWKPTPTADVLMLGDSFCMIYENDQAGIPLSAGLPQQLSYELERPLDRICLPGGGSYTSRLRLAYDLGTGSRRLTQVRVVIWQFTVRDLAVGDWRVIDLPDTH